MGFAMRRLPEICTQDSFYTCHNCLASIDLFIPAAPPMQIHFTLREHNITMRLFKILADPLLMNSAFANLLSEIILPFLATRFNIVAL
jgi:hypothetical protein